MKYFNCYYYDNCCCERTICIVTAENIEKAKTILAITYADIDSSDWDIEEMTFSDGHCEVYYGG